MGISTVVLAILRNDGVYIAGIKNNTRATEMRNASITAKLVLSQTKSSSQQMIILLTLNQLIELRDAVLDIVLHSLNLGIVRA